MSDTAKAWSAVMLWLACGLCTTAVAARRHTDWYYWSRNDSTPDAFLATMTTVAWPLTLLALIAMEAVPPQELSPWARREE
jgi:hypothetical protein